MLQKALMVIGLIVVMVVGGLVFFANIKLASEEAPLVLQEWHNLDHAAELEQWRTIWDESKNQIKRVEVIADEPDSLRVRVAYHYSGDQGEPVFVCGGIALRNEHVKWTCRPESLVIGDGEVILQFQTGQQATDYECSAQLVVSIYKTGEMPFYSNYFAYIKTWVKGEKGTLGRLKQRLHTCPGLVRNPVT
ncbi:hypothetical protein MNBD_GAMMA16-1772 [hydrothermal vent metagenome]|uniref:Uncharacterized protein n=1 Tax=hydrothermal vent metagenome TaxID=652676 RepID=A0A3B0YX18_9ZZZZ